MELDMCRKSFAVTACLILIAWSTASLSASPSSAAVQSHTVASGPPSSAASAPPPVARATAPRPVTERFKVYKTQNMWTVLLLDTRTGRLWQAQYTIAKDGVRGSAPVSDVAQADGPDGRFSLTLTDNIWNSVLVDSQTGKLWQCQFSLEESGRGCVPIDLADKSVGPSD